MRRVLIGRCYCPDGVGVRAYALIMCEWIKHHVPEAEVYAVPKTQTFWVNHKRISGAVYSIEFVVRIPNGSFIQRWLMMRRVKKAIFHHLIDAEFEVVEVI